MTLPITGPLAVSTVSPVSAAGPVQAAVPTSGAGFASELSRGLDWLQQTQSTADNLAVKAATGDLTDVHDYMIASTQASLATELTVAVRNKAVDAFNEIMRMQA
jgi:flagellar hook-basal body complex protein FliE